MAAMKDLLIVEAMKASEKTGIPDGVILEAWKETGSIQAAMSFLYGVFVDLVTAITVYNMDYKTVMKAWEDGAPADGVKTAAEDIIHNIHYMYEMGFLKMGPRYNLFTWDC